MDTPHIDETVAACHSVLGLMARAGRGNTPDRPRLEAVIERDHGAREREVPAEHAIADQAGASLAGR